MFTIPDIPLVPVLNLYRPPKGSLRRLGKLSVNIVMGVFLLAGLWGCEGASDDSPVLARFEGQELRLATAQALLPSGLSPEDSTELYQRFVEQWKLQQALAHKALQTLPEIEAQIAPRVADYRHQLLAQALYDHLLAQNLDTTLRPEAIKAYYDSRRQEFVAPTYLYQYYYVKTDNEDTPQLRKRLASPDPADIEVVRDWVKTHPCTYHLSDDWVEADMLEPISQEIGVIIQAIWPGSPVLYTTSVVKGVKYFHALYLKGRVQPGEPLPLELVEPRIRQILLNQRRQELIRTFETQVLQEAHANRQFE